jgi:hypothetical protein
MHPYEYNLSVRLRHPKRDLAEVFELLKKTTNFVPGRTWKVDDDRQTPKGGKLDGKYDESYCFLNVFSVPQKSEVEDSAAAIRRVLNLLTPIKDSLGDHVNTGGEIELFLAVYIDANSGMIFDPVLLKALSELNITLQFDVYPPDNDEK